MKDSKCLASIRATSDDPFQLQTPMKGNKKLLMASINENDGTLTWHTIPLST